MPPRGGIKSQARSCKIKAGTTQEELRDRLSWGLGFDLDGGYVVKNASSGGNSLGAEYWYEVTFDPRKSDIVRNKLIEAGFKIGADEHAEYNIRVSTDSSRIRKQTKAWWNAERLAGTTMFSAQEGRKFVECFLNEKEGILFVNVNTT